MNNVLCSKMRKAYEILAKKINYYFIGSNDINILSGKKLQKLAEESFREAKKL